MKRAISLSMLLALSACGALNAQAPAQPAKAQPIAAPALPGSIPLYGADEPTGEPEQWSTSPAGRAVRNVVSPMLIPVLPSAKNNSGLAIIVLPGGGFSSVAIDDEGFDEAHWLADHGIAAFVLKYRTRPTPRDSGYGFLPPGVTAMGRPGGGGPGGPGGPPAAARGTAGGPGGPGAQRAPGGGGGQTLPADAMKDARTAVELVRSRAAEWKVDPARVGMVGFSAGAEITLAISVNADKEGRPDFFGSIYGPLSSRDVPDDAPAMFAALASDDPIMGNRGLDLIGQYRAAKRPVEFHLFEHGGHAFGLVKQGKTSDLWIDEFYAWLKDRGLLAPAAK